MDKALENDIKIYMASRIAEEVSLSDIQNEVNAKFNLSLTYMDIRILASTLDIDWQAKAAAKAEEAKKEAEEAAAAEEVPAEAPAEETAESDSAEAAAESEDVADAVSATVVAESGTKEPEQTENA